MDGCHALWYDNFSKIYSVKTPSILSGSWKDCLWTGVAIQRYEGKFIDMKLQHERGTVVPALPDSISMMASHVLSMVASCYDESVDYLDASLVVKYSVSTIPLKPKGRTEQEKKTLAQSMDGMRNLLPEGLIRINIGSNRGLLRILRLFYEDRQMHIPGGCQRYYVLNLDINIYDRTLKVDLCLYVTRLERTSHRLTRGLLIINM